MEREKLSGLCMMWLKTLADPEYNLYSCGPMLPMGGGAKHIGQKWITDTYEESRRISKYIEIAC